MKNSNYMTMNDFVEYFNNADKIDFCTKDLQIMKVPNSGRVLPTLRYYGYIDDEKNVTKRGITVQKLQRLIIDRNMRVAGLKKINKLGINSDAIRFFSGIKVGDIISTKAPDLAKNKVPYYTTFGLVMRAKGYINENNEVLKTIDIKKYIKESKEYCYTRYQMRSEKIENDNEYIIPKKDNLDPIIEALNIIKGAKLDEKQIVELISIVRSYGINVSATKTIEY